MQDFEPLSLGLEAFCLNYLIAVFLITVTSVCEQRCTFHVVDCVKHLISDLYVTYM